ncbi:MAG: hypothetical protein ACK4UN_14655, partial [Limisphaerales bacterium]
ARKRVSRALERVTEFFRQRGFSVPLGAGSAALLTQSTQAAPADLVSLAASSALASAKSVSGLPLLLFYFMQLGTKKLLVGCAVLAAVPLLWQEHALAKLDREHQYVITEIRAAEKKLQALEEERARVSGSIVLLESEAQSNQLRLATLNAQRTGKIPPPKYQWDDSSPYMRIPKELLHTLPVSIRIEDQKVELSEVAKDFLQMTTDEAEQVQAAVQEFFDGYEEALAGKVRLVEPTPHELRNEKADSIRVFDIASLEEEVAVSREIFFSRLENILGEERFPLFRQSLREWMPLDDQKRGLNSSMDIYSFPHRRIFHKPDPGDGSLSSQLTTSDGSSLIFPVQVNRIPRAYAAYLQDWIDLAKTARVQQASE